MLSVEESLCDEVTHSAFKLHELGYKIHCTKGTKKFMDKVGVPCVALEYPCDMGVEGSNDEENVITYLKTGKIDLCINIPTHKSKRLNDNYDMRRTAVDFNVPLMTNMQVVNVFTNAANLYHAGEFTGLDAKKLFDYYKEEKEVDAWTDPNEFH